VRDREREEKKKREREREITLRVCLGNFLGNFFGEKSLVNEMIPRISTSFGLSDRPESGIIFFGNYPPTPTPTH